MFTVGADYRDRNLFGRAVRLDVQLRWSNASLLRRDQPGDPPPADGKVPSWARIGNADRVQVVLRAPEPFGFPAGVEGVALYNLEDKPLFFERRVATTARLLRDLLDREDCRRCPGVSASLGYELVASEFDPVGEITFDDELRQSGTFARLVPQVSVDTRDSSVDPQRGFRIETRFELAHPTLVPGLDDASAFTRFIASAEGYVRLLRTWRETRRGSSLGGPVVLALSLTYGIAQPLGAAPGIPISETFYYGGDARVRGLADRASATVTPGARLLAAGTAEVRWFIARDVGFGGIQLAFFGDVGAVAYSGPTLLDDPTITAGPVLRYVTPIGPVSLAYGLPVVLAKDLVSQGRLHFSFGYSM
jgi:hypothetical protein